MLADTCKGAGHGQWDSKLSRVYVSLILLIIKACLDKFSISTLRRENKKKKRKKFLLRVFQ